MSVLLATFACTGDGAPTNGHGRAILPWNENPAYWAWDGEEPVLLLGAGSDDNLFQSATFAEEIKQLTAAGGNYVRCSMHSKAKGDLQPFAYDSTTQKFILDRPDSTYWGQFADFLRVAAAANTVVQLENWDGNLYAGYLANQPDFEKVFANLVLDQSQRHQNIIYLDDLKNSYVKYPRWKRELYARMGSAAVGQGLENNYGSPMCLTCYDITGSWLESGKAQYGIKGQRHWDMLLDLRDSINGLRPLPLNAAALTGHGPNPDVIDGTFQFNRALLAGHAAARHARAPIGSGFSGEALSSIRTVRTIEQSFKFWDLAPAPEIIVGEPGVAYPAKDSLDNYLIYLAGPGSVTVRLNTADQVPMRVSVVGYLGTRRSEVLEPPYDSRFTLSTEDERGAWLLMERLK